MVPRLSLLVAAYAVLLRLCHVRSLRTMLPSDGVLLRGELLVLLLKVGLVWAIP